MPNDSENQNVNANEETTTAESEQQEIETNEHQTDESDDQKADKIVEKLQKRIDTTVAQKNEYKVKLDKALERIAKLEKGEDPEKPEPVDERDTEIAKLQAQIKRRDITDQARSVLAEGGINVPEDVLSFVVTDDNKDTLANVKSLITYIQSIREDVRQDFLKGTTPRVTGSSIKTMTKDEIMAIKDDDERKQAIKDNFQLFS